LKTLLRKAWLLALLLTVAFILTACGGTGGRGQGSGSEGEQGTADKSGGMAGMDHS
jgi:predicted small secreted protein